MTNLKGTIIKLPSREEAVANPFMSGYLDWLNGKYGQHWDAILQEKNIPSSFSINPSYHGKWATVAAILENLGPNYFDRGTHIELGARGSFFASYIARHTNTVIVSDNFVSWPMLGDLPLWKKIWERFSSAPISTVDVDCTYLGNFADNIFDSIVTISVIEHLPDEKMLRKSFDEAYRVLKPGSLYIVDTDMIPGEHVRWFGYQNFFSLPYLNAMATQAGFIAHSAFHISEGDLHEYPGLGTRFCCGLLYFQKPPKQG